MKVGGRIIKIWLFLGLCGLVTGYIGVACSSSGFQSAPPAPHENLVESAYCNLNQNFPGGLAIAGSAQFHARVNLPNECPLGSADPNHANMPAAVRPIRFAEVQILDENNQIIQCGQTDATGQLVDLTGVASIIVPRNRNLTVKVNSRSLNSHLQASVLDTPTNNAPYSITATFSSGAGAEPRQVGQLVAPAISSDLRGGAFNILNNFLRENEALRFHTCGAIQPPYAGPPCFAFSSTGDDVAPRVVAYWAKGVNPYTYFGGNPNSGISFFIPGTDKLYILGGINGDVDNTDTDHFDDAVISHEYGHFLEDRYAKLSSPGGSHNGNRILDARLVWSEGWANFISSATRTDKYYRDSSGNIDGISGGGCFFNYDIDRNFPSLDVPSANREGNFREFAIARALWDVIDVVPVPIGHPTPPPGYTGSNGTGSDDNTTDSNTESLGTLWNAFKTLSDANLHFRSMGLFIQAPRLPASIGSSNSMTFQKMHPDITDYGLPLKDVAGESCLKSTITITPKDPTINVVFNGALICTVGSHHTWCSNQFASNDFFRVDHDGSISNITLTRVSGNGDIDLYLYKENYTFENVSSDSPVNNTDPMPPGGNPRDKAISLSGVPAGTYMLNVSAFENPSASSQYQLFINQKGVAPCP